MIAPILAEGSELDIKTIDDLYTKNSEVQNEFNSLIDENYKLVQKNGYAELRIPQSLHRIPREKISANAIDVAEKLINAGFQAYLVGGSVRDLVLGTEVNDFDITTDAAYEDMKRIFVKNFKGNSKYESCKISYPDEVIDVQRMYNVPAAYHGLKNVPDFDPKERFSGSILNDAFQRDITFNSLYYDLKTGDIIDFVGGLHDLREGIIDFAVDVDAHLREVPRVVLRILRFKARYGFKFADRIEKVMRENVMEYMNLLRPENFTFNLEGLFCRGYALKSYEVLNDYGVFPYLFPSVKNIAETEEYKKYAENAMKFLDNQHKTGKKILKAFALS